MDRKTDTITAMVLTLNGKIDNAHEKLLGAIGHENKERKETQKQMGETMGAISRRLMKLEETGREV